LIDAGLATYVELRDHLTLDEAVALNDLLDVRIENEARGEAYYRQQSDSTM